MNARDVAFDALRRRLESAMETKTAAGLLSREAVQEAEALARAIDPGEDLHAAHLLGTYHWSRYQVLPDGDDEEDLRQAVAYLYPVYLVNPLVVPEQLHGLFTQMGSTGSRDPAGKSDRAIELFEVYQRTGQLALLVQVVDLFREDLHAVSEDHPDYPGRLNNLGGALQTLFRRTGDAEALAEAVDVHRRAVAATPEDHSDRAGNLGNLAIALRALFGRTGDAAALAESIGIGRSAVAAVREGDPDRAGHLGNLGGTLWVLFERTGDAEVLAEAVAIDREAVAATPEDHPDCAMYLNNLAIALRALSGRTGDLEVLTEAVDTGRRAVAATPEDHPDRPGHMSSLGTALLTLFERTGELDALTEAVDVGRRAVAATPEDHPDRAMYLGNLGIALRAFFGRTGELDALTEAVDVGRRAVAAIPEDHPDRAGHMSNLGTALQTLFVQTGELDALTEAVDAGRRAVAATPEDHPDRAKYLNNLGNALHTLFERTGDTSTLTEAVDVGRQAAAAPEGQLDRVMYVNNLGIALRALFERNGDTGTLTEAVELGRWAVAATPADHPNQAMFLNNLGIALRALFRHTEDVEALAEAVDVARQAVAATPENHTDRAMYLNNLGNALRLLFEQTGDLDTLTEAVDVHRLAVAAAPEDHPDRAGHLSNLGGALQTRFEQTADAGTLAEATDCFRSAARNTNAAVFVRVQAFRQFAALVGAGTADTGEAMPAVESAVALLPQISPRLLAREDREHRISRLGSLAEVAVSAALTAGDPQRAVELLEATRGMLVADAIDSRSSDVARLRQHNAELAREFEDLRDRREALDHVPAWTGTAADTVPGGLDPLRDDLARMRRSAQAEWDGLVGRIRALEGFTGFLATRSTADLTAQLDQGPVVFLVADSTRCDALILTGDPANMVQPVALDRLTRQDAYDRANDLLQSQRTATNATLGPAARMAAQRDILKVLAWLWDTVAEPVLTALGHTATPAEGEEWPRVWWCPVGVMGYLPLHAAGRHDDIGHADPAVTTAPPTVLDRVVSSYTPTVRALSYARSHPPVAADAVLVVAVPDAPGTEHLPSVEDEADAIKSLIPTALRPDRPQRAEVLAALPTHPVAHFSCHGLADWEHPAASRLLLYDHERSPLTVTDLSALHLTGTLAFLSACGTSSTSLHLADEAVHLTGAFHLAGYQNVIGTLWPVDERAATRITTDFYTRLTSNGTTTPDIAISASALHHAVRTLRAAYPITPTHWAAHTHTGI